MAKINKAAESATAVAGAAGAEAAADDGKIKFTKIIWV